MQSCALYTVTVLPPREQSADYSDTRLRAREWSDIDAFNFNSSMNVLAVQEGTGLSVLVCYAELLVAGVLYFFILCTALGIDSYLYTF